MPGTCSSYAGLRYFRDVAKRCGPLMAAVGDQLPCQTAQLTIVRTGLRRELTAGSPPGDWFYLADLLLAAAPAPNPLAAAGARS